MSNLSSSYSHNLTIGQILTQAFRKARVLGAGETLDPADSEMGTEIAQTILHGWIAGAKMFRHVEETTLTLVAGQATYGSSDGVTADIIDIVFPANITDTSGDRSVVDRMTHSEYMEIGDRTSTGVPTRVLVRRLDEVKLTFDPPPDATVTTFTYVKHRLPKNVEAGKNVDLFPQYLKAFITAIAYEVADHYRMPESFLRRLAGERDELFKVLKEDAAEPGDLIFKVGF